MAEEHVVGIFLVHMLSLTAIVIPFNGPSGTGAASSGTTYTSAFTLAFLFSTTWRHEARSAVVARKREERLRCPIVLLCCRHRRMVLLWVWVCWVQRWDCRAPNPNFGSFTYVFQPKIC